MTIAVKPESKKRTGMLHIPQGIWGIGLSNLFINVSMVMVYSLSAIFLTSVLGASAAVMGLLDGVVEAVALTSRIFSGVLSDYLRRRKLLLGFAYGLAFISRIMVALSASVGGFFAGRLTDRLSNGLQAAPRDALVGDIAPKEIKGECYGLRHALTVVGSFAGALVVIPIMYFTDDDFYAVFWAACVPALIGSVLLFFMVKDPLLHAKAQGKEIKGPRGKLQWRDLHSFSGDYWGLIVVASMFMLARFSEAFLILRVKGLGVSLVYISLVMLVMNLFNSLSAYPAGVLSDRFDRRILLGISFGVLVLSNLTLAFATTIWVAFIGVALWGAQIGMSQSLLMTMVADRSPEKLRATAFGFFYFVNGILHLISSWGAGVIWDFYGPAYTFISSAIFASISLLGVGFLRKVTQ